jgi:hypothetical protein
MNTIGIDVETQFKNNLIRRLNRLKSVVLAEDGGMYHQDLTYSQVLVETAMTEDELDDWLYRTNGVEYTGTFPVKRTA